MVKKDAKNKRREENLKKENEGIGKKMKKRKFILYSLYRPPPAVPRLFSVSRLYVCINAINNITCILLRTDVQYSFSTRKHVMRASYFFTAELPSRRSTSKKHPARPTDYPAGALYKPKHTHTHIITEEPF